MDKFFRTESKILKKEDLDSKDAALAKEVKQLRQQVEDLIADVREVQAYLSNETMEHDIEDIDDVDWEPIKKKNKK